MATVSINIINDDGVDHPVTATEIAAALNRRFIDEESFKKSFDRFCEEAAEELNGVCHIDRETGQRTFDFSSRRLKRDKASVRSIVKQVDEMTKS